MLQPEARTCYRQDLRAKTMIVALGLAYSAFCLMLWAAGHQPSRVPFWFRPSGIPEHYYLVQAVLLTPLFWGLWKLYSRVAGAVAKTDALGEVQEAVGVALGGALLFGFVLPDAVVFAVWGFDRLPSAMPYYAPIAVLGVLLGSARGLRSALGLGWGRSLAASWAGFFVMALLAGLVIR